MAGETELHKTLKREGCRWLHRMGYRCIAAEVRLNPIGVVDAVGTGLFRAYRNYLGVGREVEQACFIECKASRGDFLRDLGEEGQMGLFLGDRRGCCRSRRQRRWGWGERLGKFKACLVRPLANLHYVLAPAGMIQKKELPLRWGLLCASEAGINVVVKAEWQEAARIEYVESAIARTLTGDIYRADARALNSVNREILEQQQRLAGRIRLMRPEMVV